VRRIALLCTLAIAGAGLALPASAAAASIQASGYTYKIIYNYCSGDGAYFKVKNQAAGYTPANGLTVDMQAQEKRGGRWRTVNTFAQQSYWFTRNGNTHWLKAWANWTNHVYYVRLKFKLRVWQGPYVLAKKVLYSKVC
jgi:hypothetical protein